MPIEEIKALAEQLWGQYRAALGDDMVETMGLDFENQSEIDAWMQVATFILTREKQLINEETRLIT